MEALQVLVEEGNKAKNKKKSRVTPVVTAPIGNQLAPVGLKKKPACTGGVDASQALEWQYQVVSIY
jgi:hypothetical protein